MLFKIKCLINKTSVNKTFTYKYKLLRVNFLYNKICFNFSDNIKFNDHTEKNNNNQSHALKNTHNFKDSTSIKESINTIKYNDNNNNIITVQANNTDDTKNKIQDHFKFYSLKLYDSKELDDIKHDIKEEGVYYKYGIPFESQPYRPLSKLIEKEGFNDISPNTPTENLLQFFKLDKLSSYESLIYKIDKEFNFELDMYGNKIDAGMIKYDVLEHGLPIPLEVLNNEILMDEIRFYYRYNIELPSNIEDVHPLKFIPDLKPVEDFRHTPVIPISNKDLNDHKKKVADKKRRLEFFEIDKSKLKFYSIGIVFGYIMYKVFQYVNHLNDITQYEVQKLKHRRYRYREDQNDVY